MSEPITQIVARNVTAAYLASEFKSENELAKKAGVAPNTLRYLMRPEKREPGKRGATSSNLAALERVAAALGYPTWQLMHEGFSPENPFGRVLSQREVEVYQQWESAYRSLPRLPLSPSPQDRPEEPNGVQDTPSTR